MLLGRHSFWTNDANKKALITLCGLTFEIHFSKHVVANRLRVVVIIGREATFADTAVVGRGGQFICFLLLSAYVVAIFGLGFRRGRAGCADSDRSCTIFDDITFFDVA